MNALGKIQKGTKFFRFQNLIILMLLQILMKMVVKRFMASSLLSLVDDLTEGIHKIKCNDCDFFLEYESVKSNLVKYKCLSCNEDYSNKLDEKLK